jgi:hypothetical protein
MKHFDMRGLFRFLVTLLVAMLLIMPAFAQEDAIVPDGDGFDEVAVGVIVVTAFGIGLLGGIGGLLGVLNWLTGNERIMSLLEKRYDSASNGTKELIGTIDKALDVIESVSRGVLPETIVEVLDEVDDFIEEVSDGKPMADKAAGASNG